MVTVKEEAQGLPLDVHSTALEGYCCHLHNTPWSLLVFPFVPKPGSALLPRAEQEQWWQPRQLIPLAGDTLGTGSGLCQIHPGEPTQCPA